MNLIHKYALMLKQMGHLDRILLFTFVISICSALASMLADTNKGGLKTLANGLGQVLATVVFTVITMLQIVLQVAIDLITLILTLITGAITTVIMSIKFIKLILTELSKFLIKNLPEEDK